LEHEYEGVLNRNLPVHSFADFWTYHEEGSLKDNGAEYVFSNPIFGSDAYNALEWLVSHAKDSKWKCTKRTGIHVHLDVRDLTVPQFAGMSLLYAALEPILYHWIGDGRASSHFCIPLYRADQALQGACRILSAAHLDAVDEGSQSALEVSEHFQRYAGYNLQALHKFGSVEFRQLQTTHDLQRIVDWINIVMSLKAAAYKLPQSDGAVVRMLERMEIQELFGFVFLPDLAQKLATAASEEEFRTLGLPTARDLAVHGCNGLQWVQTSFPKGENAGFIKWIKSSKPVSKQKSYEEADFDDLDIDDIDDEAPNPEPPRWVLPEPAVAPNQVEMQVATAQVPNAGNDWGWIGNREAAVFNPEPIAPPPLAPPGMAADQIEEPVVRARRNMELRENVRRNRARELDELARLAGRLNPRNPRR